MLGGAGADPSCVLQVSEDKLNEYNEAYAAMNLVLFDDAINHVCRISRITDNPCGVDPKLRGV